MAEVFDGILDGPVPCRMRRQPLGRILPVQLVFQLARGRAPMRVAARRTATHRQGSPAEGLLLTPQVC